MSDEMKLVSICAQMGLHKHVVNGKEKQRNVPFMLVGLPGIGKTQIIQGLGDNLANQLGRAFPVEVFTAPQRMPEEVGGIPVPFYEQEEVKCLPMRIGKTLLKAGAGIIAVDEYSSANQAMGGACMTMIQDGRLGDLQLPSSVARGAMMNPPECAANGRSLTAPESNRFCWIDWNIRLNDWIDYMQGGKGTLATGIILPAKWEQDFGMKMSGLVISFLQRNQELFDVSKTMPKAHDCNKPWASPRSWENTSRLLAACESVGERPDSDLAYLATKGCLGEGPADAFMGWFRDMDLPDPEELLKDPKRAQKLLPDRPDKLQVALESVATAAIQDHKNITKRWETAWKVLGPTLQNQPDNSLYAAKILASAIQKVPDAETPAEAGVVRELLERIGLK
jgi:hypothetical protein